MQPPEILPSPEPLITADLINGIGPAKDPKIFERHKDLTNILLDPNESVDLVGLQNQTDALTADIQENPDIDDATKTAVAEFKQRAQEGKVDFEGILQGVDASDLPDEDKAAMKELAISMKRDIEGAGPDASSEVKASIIKKIASNSPNTLKLVGGIGAGLFVILGLAAFKAFKSVSSSSPGR